MPEDDVHRAGDRVEDVDEAERRRDRRRERRQVEDGAEHADAHPRAGQHHREAEGEEHLQRDEHADQPERVLHRRPDLRVLPEEVVVVRPADPPRRRQQVVVVEGEVRAHHERVPEEDGEADEPGAHEEEHEAAAPPRCLPPGSPAIDRQRGRGERSACDRGLTHGTPGPFAWATMASICLSSAVRPAWRFFTSPACHFVANFCTWFVYDCAGRRDRRRGRVRVVEDLDERREVRVRLDLRRLARGRRRRHVADARSTARRAHGCPSSGT